MIPVFEPHIDEEEINAVVAALRKGEISGTFGKLIPEFEEKFAAYCDCKYGIAVSSGTAALHLAVAAARINRGDEILVSASTNIATALAVYHNNGIPVPVDAEETTWNININLIESLITKKTKAIIPVHLFGHPVEMVKLLAIAKKYGLVVIEDCAEAHGATCHGKKTGSFGDMSCFSFYANKIITTGEGGMVLTNDKSLAKELRLLRNLAFSKPRFYHKQPGYNFRITGYQAAMGVQQLNKIEKILATKRNIAATYNNYLKGIEELNLPGEQSWAKNVYWMYALTLKNKYGIKRDDLLSYLKKNDIDTRTFFCPINQQPFLKEQEGYRELNCPVADNLWETGFYLPSSYNLTENQIEFIANHIKDFIRNV